MLMYVLDRGEGTYILRGPFVVRQNNTFRYMYACDFASLELLPCVAGAGLFNAATRASNSALGFANYLHNTTSQPWPDWHIYVRLVTSRPLAVTQKYVTSSPAKSGVCWL